MKDIKRFRVFIILVSAFCLAIFTLFSWVAGQTKKVNVRVVAQIGHSGDNSSADDPYLFSQIWSATCDTEGNVYVLDYKDVCVKAFDQSGKFLRKMFREGRGPEEIEAPYLAVINKYSNHLFVLNMYGTELKEFDLSGKYINVFHLPHQIGIFFDFIDQDRLIFINTRTDERIRVLNLHSMEFEKGLAKTEPVPSVVYGNQRFVIKDGILWTCHNDETVLTGYDFDSGKEVERIPIPEKYEKYVIDKGENVQGAWWVARIRQFAQPIILNDTLYVLFTRWGWTSDKPAKEKSRDLFLYRLNGKRLEKVTDLPEGSFMFLGDTWKNRLILYGSDPYPQVKILEIIE
ncbi:MAG TPA: 6-bladed beta-propeller [Candidatus Saccharicenans sp.]|nr:6-bladed beta-propeller [Candidatus Saccharicenans sp.]